MGHRLVPHTADVTVEAWAPTRERCLAEAVRGAVASFVDVPPHTSPSAAGSTRQLHVRGDTDEDLLVALLDEVIYLLDTTGEAPVRTVVTASGSGVDVSFEMAGVLPSNQVGAVPKAVSLSGLRLGRSGDEWRCSVTLDV